MLKTNSVDDAMLKRLQIKSLSDRVERLANTLNAISIFIQHNDLGDHEMVCDKYPFSENLEAVVASVNQWALAIEYKRLNMEQESETDEN